MHPPKIFQSFNRLMVAQLEPQMNPLLRGSQDRLAAESNFNMKKICQSHSLVWLKITMDSVLMSSKGHIRQMLEANGWDKESPSCPKPCKDGEAKGDLVSPMILGAAHLTVDNVLFADSLS